MVPEVSVIMLTYNREGFVERMVRCILNQTFQDFEFIIVDNGSTDRSGKICDDYATGDSRVHVIHRQRGNIGSGRNAGLDEACGRYIAFVDDDDWVEPDFLEFLHGVALSSGADVSICGFDKEENGKTVPSAIHDDVLVMDAEQAIITLMWRKRYNTGFPTKMFKSALLSELRFPETGRYDDIALMYQVLADAKRVVSQALPKYHVYRHENNNSMATAKDHQITSEYLAAYRQAYRERTEWLCRRFPGNEEYWRYFDWSFQLSMAHKIFVNNLKNCSRHLNEIRSELAGHYDELASSPHLQDYEYGYLHDLFPEKAALSFTPVFGDRSGHERVQA